MNWGYKMNIESSSELYRHQAETAIDFFTSSFNLGADYSLSCPIKICPDIKKDIYRLSSDDHKRKFDITGVPDLNGYLVQPKSDELDFIILISEKQFIDLQYIHTIVHELVHLNDYFRYYQKNGNLSIRGSAEQNKAYYREFYYWSEFHAKRIGFIVYAIYKYRIEAELEAPPNDKYEFIIDFQTKSIIDSLDRFLSNTLPALRNDLFWDFISTLIGYYGRQSVPDTEDPAMILDEAFPRDKLIKTFGNPVIDLFPLLRVMDTYEKAIPRLPSLNTHLESIITKLNTDISPWSYLETIMHSQLPSIYEQLQDMVHSLNNLPSGLLGKK